VDVGGIHRGAEGAAGGAVAESESAEREQEFVLSESRGIV